ncbi:tetratricopeptide repeat protein [Kitasatospora sp. NPDC048540]|uniref:tetratricopeptide repeat protein n=1 Tax=Kitasatospora sp. NPDC048540 TaxID=3155634 RepID=UPI0033F6FA51
MATPRTPNQQLADVMDEAGLTLEALARATKAVAAESGVRLGTSRSAVHAWVSSGAFPAGSTPAYVAEALSRKLRRPVTAAEIGWGEDTGTDLMLLSPAAAATETGRLLVHPRRDFLALGFSATALLGPLAPAPRATAAPPAVGAGRRIGSGEIMAVRQFTAAFRASDELLGGGHGLSVAGVFLSDVVAPMLHGTFAGDRARTDAFAAAADLATLIGFKCHDAGREGAAQRHYQLAIRLARETDPDDRTGQAAWGMRALVHQALDLGQRTGTVDLAEAALARTRGRVDKRTEALLLITAARAHGAGGNPKAAAALIDAAREAARTGTDALPSYAAAAGPTDAVIASHTGRTLTEMGHHAAAEKHYRAALSDRTDHTYRRARALTLANVARAVAAQDRHEEAVDLLARSVGLMDGIASHRTRRELDRMRPQLLLYARRGIRGAADLADRASRLAAA